MRKFHTYMYITSEASERTMAIIEAVSAFAALQILFDTFQVTKVYFASAIEIGASSLETQESVGFFGCSYHPVSQLLS